MSICPDAQLCESIFEDVLAEVGSITNLKTEYVASINADGSFYCKHGEPECEGNKQQLCAYQLYPNPNIWFQFVNCQSTNYLLVPDNAASCAAQTGIDYTSLSVCVNTIGNTLFADSIRVTESRSITKSCSIVIEEEVICIRDGSWYDCPGGYSVDDFVRQICQAYTGNVPPAACSGKKF